LSSEFPWDLKYQFGYWFIPPLAGRGILFGDECLKFGICVSRPLLVARAKHLPVTFCQSIMFPFEKCQKGKILMLD
jgi:hypothetical protein